MTENEFWLFLKNALAKGRAMQCSSTIDSGDPQVMAAGQYIGGHSLLPKDYQSLSRGEISAMGELLFNEVTAISTKEAILIYLAHQPAKEALSILRAYHERPDEELKVFAHLALDECEMWNDDC
ncbi:MAG: hypothetical protein ISS26_06245 [Candidatus Omnitrophica bacterium]|nr:hypothetical protein [Candidatus Omnitrophota bacterium]